MDQYRKRQLAMPGAATGLDQDNGSFAAMSRERFAFNRGVFCLVGMSTFPVFWRDARLGSPGGAHSLWSKFKREILQTLLADDESAERAWARPEALRERGDHSGLTLDRNRPEQS